MRVFALDPGMKRSGWAIVEAEPHHDPVYLYSGVWEAEKPSSSSYQEYRVEFTKQMTPLLMGLAKNFSPDLMVNEIVPSVGSYGGTQMYLANVSCTIWHTCAVQQGIEIKQVGATTVHKAMTGKGRNVTKPQVRNGVFRLIPELEDQKSRWTKVFEEPDALAIALTALGYRNDKDGSTRRRDPQASHSA